MAADGEHAPGRVALIWDEAVAGYDFGPGHPLAPVRVELTVDLIRRCGLLVPPGAGGKGSDGTVVEVVPEGCDEGVVRRRHAGAFVDTVKRASHDPVTGADPAFGLGAGDTPAFAGMHAASLLVCAHSLEAARLVLDGRAAHAFNPAGGLHHAMPGRAAGFCVYNDPALAIDRLLEGGAERVAYVDIDVHHGDGVEAMFVDDPRVLTISLHESGRFLFPGTGAADDIGGPGAEGSAVNVPLHPGTTGEVWLGAFDEVVEPLVRAFAPDVLVSQLGCDGHATDPLAHLALTVDDMAAVYTRIHRLAHEAAGGRWVATGGGGYQLVDVVPRAWTTAFAEMSDQRLPIETPIAWRELVAERTGARAPTAFTDDPAHVSAAIAEQARRGAEDSVAAVRRLVFPRHGLPPEG